MPSAFGHNYFERIAQKKAAYEEAKRKAAAEEEARQKAAAAEAARKKAERRERRRRAREADSATREKAVAKANVELKQAVSSASAMEEKFTVLKTQNYGAASEYSRVRSHQAATTMSVFDFDPKKINAAPAAPSEKAAPAAASDGAPKAADASGASTAEPAAAKAPVAKPGAPIKGVGVTNFDTAGNLGNLAPPRIDSPKEIAKPFENLPPANTGVFAEVAHEPAAAARGPTLRPSLRKVLETFLSGALTAPEISVLSDEAILVEAITFAGGEARLVEALQALPPAPGAEPFRLLASDIAGDIRNFLAGFEDGPAYDDASLFTRIKRPYQELQRGDLSFTLRRGK